MKLVMIDVGLGGGMRGLVFPDMSFVFFPIPAAGWDCRRLQTYAELRMRDYTHSKYANLWEFRNAHLSDLIPELADMKAHNDPDFKYRTYGHVKRGYGYEPLLESLQHGDILLFLATLDYRSIDKSLRSPQVNPEWGGYIVGAFEIERWFTREGFEHAPDEDRARFRSNPHSYCKSPADLWIAGKEDTLGLFRKAVPLSSPREGQQCLPLLSENFRTWSGKRAGRGAWYRHAVACKKHASRVWNEIRTQGDSDE